MSVTRRLVIVGNGMAGARLAELVLSRQSPGAFEIVIFGDEPGGSYNRILLSGVLAGSYAGPDIVTHPSDWYTANAIALRAGTRVDRVDVSARTVIDARGGVEPFDLLVLATGSRPHIPTIDGLDPRALPEGTYVFRTVDDCARIAAAAARASRAVVIGGGLLGLEAARGLAGHGVRVTVVHLAEHLMEGQLDAAGGEVLRAELVRLGISILTERRTTRVIAEPEVAGIELSDGTRLDCDLVVLAAGVVPNTDLARGAGLRVNRGIVVGDDLACPGAHGVFAIGDCAEHRGRAYGLVAPAWEQADVLAARLTATRPGALYLGTRLATKLKVAGIDVAVMGDRDAGADDELVTYMEPGRGIYNRVILRDNRVAGAILIGTAPAAASLVQYFLGGSTVPAQRFELLFPPSGDIARQAVEQIPDTARICDCNAVAKAQIVDAVLNGARSVRAVCEHTRAGTGCGSCRPEVQRIVDFVCQEIERPTRGARDVDAAEPLGGARAPV